MNFGHLFGKKSKSKSSKNSNDNEKFETNVKNSTQIQEKIPAREAIHSDGVLNVYPVDTSTILSGSQDRTLVLYDFINHRIRRRWTGHENDVVKVLYGHIVNLVVSASRDRTIHFWNINSDLPVQKLLGHELVVTAIDFNPENSVLISGSRDNKIIFWDTKTGQILKKIMIGRNLITDAKWSHDGTFIAQTGEDKETNGAEISLWDIRQRKLLSEFYGHRATVNSGHFVDPTASMIISCSNDGRAILWNVQQTSIFAELDVDNATPLTSIIAVNTQNFATGGLNGKVSFVQRLNRQLQLTDQI
ncbi:unnamed protein product [Rotaria sp. Silwood1]|nr:unnamed protein product [Rotaria sp. Silwood1]